MCMSCNHKNWKIFVDQYKYLDKVLAYIMTNPTSTLLLLGYVFKLNDKQYNLNFCQNTKN